MTGIAHAPGPWCGPQCNTVRPVGIASNGVVLTEPVKPSKRAYEGWEEDMQPPNICGNCLTRSTRANPVRYDDRYGRRLCHQCEPHPVKP